MGVYRRPPVLPRQWETAMLTRLQPIADAHPGVRMACCGYGCSNLAPSDPKLAFFQKDRSTEICAHCGYHEDAHTSGRVSNCTFAPSVEMPVDRYYCGCGGWD